LGLVAIGAAVTYALPKAETLRPWLPGEPIPLLRLLAPADAVTEDAYGELTAVPEYDVDPIGDSEQQEDLGTAAPVPISLVALLPERPPAVRTVLELPETGFDALFQALASAESGEPGRLVRILHWGDSTIAADGIAGQARKRLQERFGDGGPGFLPVHADPRWSYRPGVLRIQNGTWETRTLTFAGAEERRYGLAGMVSTATEEATATLGGERIDGKRKPLHRFEVYYQTQPDGGGFSVKPRGAPGRSVQTSSTKRADRFVALDAPNGATTVHLSADGAGPVSIYGIALEAQGPGVTWETYGVAGSSTGSMLAHQGAAHIKGQVARRIPDLLIYQTGGNELTYPGLEKEDGEEYEAAYIEAFGKLRAGAPDASCLVISPVDQATRERGKVISKPQLDKLVRVQRRAAEAAGCGFWDARHAMGGNGSFARWLHHEPRYAWTDLMHLTTEGLDILGDCLADALLASYDQWAEDNPELGWRPPVDEVPSTPSPANRELTPDETLAN